MVKHDKLDHKKLMTIVCQHCDFKTNRIRVLRKHLVNQHSDNTVFDDQMYHYGRSILQSSKCTVVLSVTSRQSCQRS